LIEASGRDDWTASPAVQLAADAVSDLLVSYGLDARSRSALRACFRHAEADAERGRGDDLAECLAESDPDITADGEALGHFLDVFALLPEADFAVEWLEDLLAAWEGLRQAGCPVDLPLRASRALVTLAGRQLLAGRPSLSALEVEILTSLSAAAMCTAEILSLEVRRTAKASAIDDIAVPEHGHALEQRLTVALAQGGSRDAGPIVGLLSLHLRLGASTLTLDLEQRDAIIEAAIGRLRDAMRQRDVIIRTELNGCAIILPGLHSKAQVHLAARKVTQALELPFAVRGMLVRPVFAMGAVWSPDHGSSAEELGRCADLAVESAMRSEKAVVYFDDDLLVRARQQALAEREFLAALDNGQLAIHVQPQIDLKTRRCVGGELLLRWTDSQGSSVPPWQIPDIALRLGAAPQLTRWLVFGACRTLSELSRMGVDIGLSVNLMARDLMDQELPLLVEQAISFWRVPPERLTFELVESAVLGDPEAGAGVMERMIALGVSTSIDDFGIGYSSILYLRQLPLHELKIDRVFVDAMARSQEDREIVAALIRLSHGLDLQVVAEGVENEETANLLRDMGCERGQGYWIGKAMPPAELPAWLEAWNRRVAGAA
jgi:diguanylate cyclase